MIFLKLLVGTITLGFVFMLLLGLLLVAKAFGWEALLAIPAVLFAYIIGDIIVENTEPPGRKIKL